MLTWLPVSSPLAGHSNREGIKRLHLFKLHRVPLDTVFLLSTHSFLTHPDKLGMTGEPSKVSDPRQACDTLSAACRSSSHVLSPVQVGGNVKAAVGSVKETVGAAVGARQMEADGEYKFCFQASRP